ncbi:MAG: hypothetical protein IEMM0008_1666 [bacterium]|nr:MAG: hypothetical protein IEMM0008_1666 [bacterium]
MLKLNENPISQFLTSLNKIEMERVITIMVETILVEIKEKKRTIQEAEKLIFNISTLELFDNYSLNHELRDVIFECMELEDIVNLVKREETLMQAINDCLKKINQIKSKY